MHSVLGARIATEAEAVRNAAAAGERLAAVVVRVHLLCCSCRLVDLSCARLVHRPSPCRSGTRLLVGSSRDRGWEREVRWRLSVGRALWRRSGSGGPFGSCYVVEGGSC